MAKTKELRAYQDPAKFVAWSPGPAEVKYKSRGLEQGPGELRLAAQLGGDVVSERSYDVLGPDGTRWEVKSVDKSGFISGPAHHPLIGRVIFELASICQMVSQDAFEPQPWAGEMFGTLMCGEACRGMLYGKTPDYPKSVFELAMAAFAPEQTTLAIAKKIQTVRELLWKIDMSALYSGKCDRVGIVTDRLGFNGIPLDQVDSHLMFSHITRSLAKFKIVSLPDPYLAHAVAPGTEPARTSGPVLPQEHVPDLDPCQQARPGLQPAAAAQAA
jgi:hypothetical protein